MDISFSIKLLYKYKFFCIYKFANKLTYSRPLTRSQTIELHLKNLGFKMLFLPRIFYDNFKDKIFKYSFLSLA